MCINFYLALLFVTFVVLCRLLLVRDLTIITKRFSFLLGECNSTFSDTPFFWILLFNFYLCAADRFLRQKQLIILIRITVFILILVRYERLVLYNPYVALLRLLCNGLGLVSLDFIC